MQWSSLAGAWWSGGMRSNSGAPLRTAARTASHPCQVPPCTRCACMCRASPRCMPRQPSMLGCRGADRGVGRQPDVLLPRVALQRGGRMHGHSTGAGPQSGGYRLHQQSRMRYGLPHTSAPCSLFTLAEQPVTLCTFPRHKAGLWLRALPAHACRCGRASCMCGATLGLARPQMQRARRLCWYAGLLALPCAMPVEQSCVLSVNVWGRHPLTGALRCALQDPTAGSGQRVGPFQRWQRDTGQWQTLRARPALQVASHHLLIAFAPHGCFFRPRPNK